MGFFWKRSNNAAGLFGIIGGIIIQLALVGIFYALGIKLHWLYLAFIAQVIIMFGMFAVSLVTTPPTREQWEPFLWTTDLLRSIEGSENLRWYQTIKFWGLVFVVIWIVLYWWFW